MYKINPFSFHHFSLDGKIEKKIFCKTSIEIKSGELVLITGPSGSGKSTVLSLLKGLVPEYIAGSFSGEILYNSRPLNGESFKKNLQEIIYLFQNPFAWAIHQKTEDEFYFAMENFKFTKEKMLEMKSMLEESFLLKNIWGQKTSELSHGECQKLALASLLAIGPKVLLLDEPTAFLDGPSRRQFYQLLNSLRGKFTIVLVDHHLNEIPKMDKVLIVSGKGELYPSQFASEENGEGLITPHTEFFAPIFPAIKGLSLQASGLNFAYKNDRLILNNLNLNLRAGDVVVISGKNGEGKSTLLKILAGILRPINGQINLKVEERLIKRNDYHKHLAFIFQNPESHFSFDSIKEELEFHLDSDQSREINSIARQMLPDVNFLKSPFMLSEGQKRRLSILLTLAQKKEILFLDEPTFGQDQESVMHIIFLIKKMQESGMIQLIISHDDLFSSQVASKRLLLAQGQLEEL